MINREDLGDIVIVQMAHGKVSALDIDFCDALDKEIRSIATGPHKAMVITGTGTTFSAGVDLFQVLDGGAEYLARFLPAMNRFLHTLLTFPKPAVAAINGHAIAGGYIIAAACDHRVMVDGQGGIALPELVLGVPFPSLPFEIVRARLSPSALHRLIYFGGTVRPSEALTLGLIDDIVPDTPPSNLVVRRACAFTRMLLQHVPGITFALTKRAFAAPVLARVSASAALDADVASAWAHPDVQQQMRRYVEGTLK